VKIPKHHRWDLTPRDAIALQRRLAVSLKPTGPHFPVTHVAGVDVSVDRKGHHQWGGIVVLTLDTLETVETVVVDAPVTFPYVPGLLSFRETPVLLKAFERLAAPPDVIICDGHGFAHPRRFGLACHLGLILGIPALGCGKSRLTGEYKEPDSRKNSWTPLTDGGERIGCVLRTRENVSPVFVSSGYHVGLAHARDIVSRCCSRYRLPETTRRAHNAVNDHRRAATIP